MRKYDSRLVTFLADRRGESICIPCIFAIMRQEDNAPPPESKLAIRIYDFVATCVICGEVTDVLQAAFPDRTSAAVA